MPDIRKHFTLLLTSLLGLLTSNSLLAAQRLNQAEEVPEKKSSLTEILMENEVFQMDSKNQTVQVDEDKLLQALRNDLEEKIKSDDVHPDDKEVYQDLIIKLKPGSFGKKVNDNSGLNSMSFDKATKSVQ